MSSSLTWQDLSTADLAPLSELAASWTAHASAMVEQAERVTGDVVGGSLGVDNFDSDTADECREQLGRLAGQFQDDIHDYASVRIAATIEELHAALETQQNNLNDLIDEVEAERFELKGDAGSERVVMSEQLATEVSEERDDPVGRYHALAERAQMLEASVRAAMESARTADDEAAALLEGLAGEAAPMPPFVGSGYGDGVEAYEEALAEHEAAEREEMLSGEADPHVVAGWWERLSESERQEIIEQERDAVRGLDGIPSQVRHEANMDYLDEYIEAHPGDRDARALRDRVLNEDLMLLGLDPRITDSGLNAPNAPGTLLGDWNVIVAVGGDPDHAENTAIYVPGVGSDTSMAGNPAFTGTDSYIDFAGNIDRSAGGGDDNVTVMWLGYDSPSGLPGAAFDAAAQEGGAALDRFTTGAAATNQVEGSSITQIGHSYGGVVTGYADQHGGGSAADRVVLVGAPGPGADNGTAQNFNVGADDVHVMHSDRDAINAATGTHGADPTSEHFGGERTEVSDREDLNTLDHHMYYFYDQDNLSELGDIVTGD
ncbi:alpha/beta hydrolase family protein [Glycomyces tarimensis]